MRLQVFSKSDCPWCVKAKEFLRQEGLTFEEVVLNDAKERQSLYNSFKLVGMDRTVPQIVLIDDLDGERMHIGGYQQLVKSGIKALNLLPKDADQLSKDHEHAMEVQIRRTAANTTPSFELLPVDKFAIPTIDFWLAQALTELPADHPKITSARRRRAEIVAWQEMYGSKTPD
jgi:glutaredoxin 3